MSERTASTGGPGTQGGGYLAHLERLAAWASHGAAAEELVAARAQFFARCGDPREDEASFDVRSEAFLEWYLLERPLQASQRTPLDQFLTDQRASLTAAEVAALEGFRGSSRALFEFLKQRGETLVLRDLQSAKKRDLYERRKLAGVEKGTLLEGRVLRFDGHEVLTRGALFHPLEVRKLVLAELKAVRGMAAGAHEALLIKLSLARLRCDRYRRVEPLRIYRAVLRGQELPA